MKEVIVNIMEWIDTHGAFLFGIILGRMIYIVLKKVMS